jgi:molybdate transport system substrate-binding protein
MKRLAVLVTLLLASFLFTAQARAESLTVASGAGYKKLVTELCATFTKQSGIEVEQIYGNMGQVTAQAKSSGLVDMVIGDKAYLDGTDLTFAAEDLIGRGKLVAVVAKGVEVTEIGRIAEPQIKRIAMPDAKMAIYGRAGTEFLQASGLMDKVRDRLLVVATVPQVSAYVVSGEVEVGFINLTDALAIKDQVAKVIPIDETLYSPILIVGKRLADAPHPAAAARFGAFLATDAAHAIAVKHGL